MSTWAVVPVKRFETAKSRLAAVLDDAARARFARGTFEHVLSVLTPAAELSGTLVVTDSEEVAAVGRELGCAVLLDPDDRAALSEVVDHGVAEVARRGATSVLVVMSDLPELTEADVRSLGRLAVRFGAVVAPDHRRTHTNALGFRIDGRPGTRFGAPDSLRQHRKDFEAGGEPLVTYESRGTLFDVDTEEDYARWTSSLLHRNRSSRTSAA